MATCKTPFTISGSQIPHPHPEVISHLEELIYTSLPEECREEVTSIVSDYLLAYVRAVYDTEFNDVETLIPDVEFITDSLIEELSPHTPLDEGLLYDSDSFLLRA